MKFYADLVEIPFRFNKTMDPFYQNYIQKWQEAGWHPIPVNSILCIFYTQKEDAIPAYSDQFKRLKLMQKYAVQYDLLLFPSQICLGSIMLITFVNKNGFIIGTFVFLLFLNCIFVLYQMIQDYSWFSLAKNNVQKGLAIPKRSIFLRKTVPWVSVGLLFSFFMLILFIFLEFLG